MGRRISDKTLMKFQTFLQLNNGKFVTPSEISKALAIDFRISKKLCEEAVRVGNMKRLERNVRRGSYYLIMI